MLYFFLQLLTTSRVVAAVASLIYVVHPVQTAAVAYISGRKDLLAAFFLLLGFIFYLIFRKDESRRWRQVLAYVAFLLAVLSKEVALVFPLLLLLIDSQLEWNQNEYPEENVCL